MTINKIVYVYKLPMCTLIYFHIFLSVYTSLLILSSEFTSENKRKFRYATNLVKLFNTKFRSGANYRHASFLYVPKSFSVPFRIYDYKIK